MAAIALTAAAGMFAERRGAARTSVALCVGLAAIATSAIALSIVWRDHGAGTPMTPTPATGALLRQFDPDSRQLAIQYDPIRRVRARDMLTNLTLAEAGADPALRDAPTITLFGLPAGVYGIEGSGPRSGALTVTVDSEFGPQWMWPPDDSPAAWRREFRLPTPVRALVLKAESGHVRVRPASIAGSKQQVASDFPEHVARYGPAVVFHVGGQAFMEAGGAWVEGGRSADFAVSAEAATPVRLLVRNPPVSNVVTLEGDGWRQYFVLAPGEERTTTLPFPPGSPAMKVRVTAAHGARPSEFEPGSTDTRFLGCWIETQP